MKAQVGDRIVLTATRVDDPTRHGTVLEVGPDGGPPFTVRWTDGRVGVFYPGPGSVLSIGDRRPGEEGESVTAPPAARVAAPPAAHAAGPAAAHASVTDRAPATEPGHVREWHIRVSIFETGDDTTARVVLLSDAPEHLQAVGGSRRSEGDDPVPEIGDEIAVARALRHLADSLLDTAEHDIEAVTGEPAQVRRG